MKKFTPMAVCLLIAGAITGTASAKDLYVSATGNNANDGLSAATAKRTLTALDAIIQPNDVVHVSGILGMNNEVPADFNPSVGYGAGDLNDVGGVFVSHDSGKKLGFNLASRGSRNWKGITFIGEDPENDGFSGDGKWGHFIIRGSEDGGYTFKNLCFVDGISNLDGGTIYIKDEAYVNFENCVFRNNHPDWSLYKLEGNAWKGQGGSSERGGCLRTEANCVVNVDKCLFENNINRQGGAILITGTANSKDINTGGVTITNSTFTNNTAFCFDDPEQYVDNSNGGAIGIWSLFSACFVKIDHCVFDSNVTWNNGGAIYILDNVKYGHYCDITISNSAFFYNESERGGALQYANYADGPMERKEYLTKTKNVNLINCTFANNHARTDGGAILLWGAMSDSTQPDYPQDSFRMVNCTVIGNSTEGNAGHGAGYKEMSRAGDGEAFGQIGNANRYFYNNLMENNYALESSELSDFTTPEIYGHNMENNYVGRFVVLGGISVEEFLAVVNDAEGVKETTVHSYSGEQLGDNFFHVASDPVATAVYDMSGFAVPGVALPDGSPVKTGGDIAYLTLDPKEYPVPSHPDGLYFVRSGYDISKTDALGFARPEGTCAAGASEYDVTTITPYMDGSMDLPYLTEGGDSQLVMTLAPGKAVKITRSGDIVAAEGAMLEAYTIAGVKVAASAEALDLSALAAGIYVVKATTADGTAAVKVVK